MEEEIKCPKCGGKNVIADDTYDSDYQGVSIIYFVCGHCKDCKANLQWRERYTYDGIDGIYVDGEEN